MRFLKITEQQISVAGRFHNIDGQPYDLQAGKQTDGAYVISEKNWNKIKQVESVQLANIQQVYYELNDLNFKTEK